MERASALWQLWQLWPLPARPSLCLEGGGARRRCAPWDARRRARDSGFLNLSQKSSEPLRAHHHHLALRPMELMTLLRDASSRSSWEWMRHVDTSEYGFEVRALAGKGFGVVAVRPFAAGERIIAEMPLLSWQTVPYYSTGRKLSAFAELRSLVADLPPDKRALYFGLADKHDKGEGKTIPSLFNTNSFKTEDVLGDSLAEGRDGISRSAIFATIARFNHACVPNTFPSWSSTIGCQTVHALRDIEAGEELTLAYVAGAEAGTRAHRRGVLKAKYCFDCVCATCQLEGAALEESDTRQARLAAIHRQLAGELGTDNESLPAVVGEHLRLMREEGLPLIWGKAGMFLLIVHFVQRGERRAAADTARQGAELACLALGEDSSVYQKFASLLEALSDTPAVCVEGALGGAAIRQRRH